VLEAGSSTKFLTISANPTIWTPFGSHKELGGASGGLDAIATGQVAEENHSAAKAKTSSSKHTHRRKPTTPASAPSTPLLIVPLGSGRGFAPPLGEEPQGPSLVDYELELEADFPPEMVLEM
jgi:hypothetical protein